MSKCNNQKLILTIKVMQLILRILFLILILMAFIPWILPTTSIAKFFLSLQGFFAIMDATHKDINDFLLTLTPFARILGGVGSVLALFPLIIGTIIMLNLFKNYIYGKIFNLYNARSYIQLGIIYFINAVLLQPICQMLFYACATINNPHGQRFIAFTIGIDSLTAIFFAIMLIIIGQVMKLGQKMSEEQELTV